MGVKSVNEQLPWILCGKMDHEKLSEQYHRNIIEFYLIPEVSMNPVFQQEKS